MPNFEDDEDLPVSSKTAASTSTAAVANDDLDVDWGDTDAMSTSDGLDRIVPSDKTSKVRVAVLTDIVKLKKAWMHFIEKDGKKGSYRCHTVRDKKNVPVGELADCCKKLNGNDDTKAGLSFAVLAVKYTNCDPKTGKYEKGFEGPFNVELGWIKLSRAGFKAVSQLIMEGEEAHSFDFTIGNRENGIGYEYARVSKNSARFRDNKPAVVAAILEDAAKYKDGQLLSKRLGKVISALDMKALLAGTKAAEKSAQIDNTDDL
jgi:hypothetical protein